MMRGVLAVLTILITQVYCQDQVGSLYYNYTGYGERGPITDIYFIVGVTINGQIGDICAAGVSNDTANSLCQFILGSQFGSGYVMINGTIGYPDFFQYFDEQYSVSYTNVSCSNSYTSCTGTQFSNCTDNGGLLSLQCSYVEPECYPETLDLNNFVNTTTGPGLYALTGRPTVCIAGKNVPICANVALNNLEIARICAYSQGLISGFTGAPPNVTVLPLDLNRTVDSVVTGFDCSSLTNCTNTTTMGTCPSGYATVTCQIVCIDNDDDPNHEITLFNQYTSSDGSNTFIAGIPQFCADGAVTRICNDGTNSPEIPFYGCNALGYQFGQLLPYNASLYVGTPPNVVYLSNFSCDASGCGNYAQYSTDSRCYGGQLELVLKCYNKSQGCNSSGVSFFANFSSVSSGQQLVSGIAVMCINGKLVPLCDEDDDFDSDDIDLVCTSMGYDGGMIRPSDPSRYGPGPQGVGYYSNFSCPLNATDTSGCTAARTNNPVCDGGNKNLVIECYLGQPTITRTATASPTPTTSSTPTTKSSSNVGLAVGVTIAVLAVVAIIVAIVVVVVFIVIRKRRSGSLDF